MFKALISSLTLRQHADFTTERGGTDLEYADFRIAGAESPRSCELTRTAATQLLQKELAAAKHDLSKLQHRQRVVELLAEHQLFVSVGKRKDQANGNNDSQEISPAFFEMLTGFESAKELERLIVERANLVRSEANWSDRMATGAPRSRDQSRFMVLTMPARTTQRISLWRSKRREQYPGKSRFSTGDHILIHYF